MKEKLIIAALATVTVSAYAQNQPPQTIGQQVYLTASFGHDKLGGIKTPKAPVQPPYVTYQDYTLFIWGSHNGYTLTLLDDDTVVYQTYVAPDTQTICLPTTLSGSYTLQLSNDTFVFTGLLDLV